MGVRDRVRAGRAGPHVEEHEAAERPFAHRSGGGGIADDGDERLGHPTTPSAGEQGGDGGTVGGEAVVDDGLGELDGCGGGHVHHGTEIR